MYLRSKDPELPEFVEGESGYCFARALAERAIPYRYLRPDEITAPIGGDLRILSFALNGRGYFWKSSFLRVSGSQVPGPMLERPATDLVKWKHITNAILRLNGLSVPQGAAVSRANRPAAQAIFAAIAAGPLGACVKPACGLQGRHVYTGIRTRASFMRAFEAAAADFDMILIEETVTGTVYRFLWLAGRVIAIRYGVPAHVVGDGVHTITELVAAKNAAWKTNRHTAMSM